MRHTDEQQNNTLQFFAELELMRKIEAAAADTSLPDDDAVSDEALAAMRQQCAGKAAPFDAEVQPYQIRLLAAPERIVYVAVLPWGDDQWVVVPFSRYENPATDTELLSVDAADAPMFMQVYQCWNLRTWYTATLQRSWVACDMPTSDIEAVKQVVKYYLLGDPVSADVVARTGAPVYKPDDPRRSYKQEAIELLAALDAADLEQYVKEA